MGDATQSEDPCIHWFRKPIIILDYEESRNLDSLYSQYVTLKQFQFAQLTLYDELILPLTEK